MRKNIAVILGAGQGVRSDFTIPKQLIKLAGKPLIEHAIAAFEKSKLIDEIAVVTSPSCIAEINSIIARAEFKKVRFGAEAPAAVGVGIKPVSQPGTERLVRAALDYAIRFGRKSVTFVHKGNIMKYTEGAFRDWGYDLAMREFGAVELDGGPWCVIPEGRPGAGIVIKDAIADITLQQVLTRPKDFDVIATLNLNGDYLSDALAAQVGGIGIAPGGNINYLTGHAIFEATHGTAPKYADKDQVNPGSLVLSGEMMLRYMGWTEAADLILKGLDGAIGGRTVTYDFERLMEGATLLKCSEFGDAIIARM